MRHAFALTLFGYGAPKTDVEAVGLMRLLGERRGSERRRNRDDRRKG